MKKVRFSVVDAVAGHLEYDRDDLKDYRYQPSRTPCIVFSDPRGSSENYTATNGKKRPRGCDDFQFGTWHWKEIEAKGYAKAMGWRIWINDENGDKNDDQV